MYVQAASATPVGLSARPTQVEVQRGAGLPGITLVGLARGAAKEALVRVRAALARMGTGLGSLKLTVGLSPAELPKTGSALDLALAASLLCALGRLPTGRLSGCRFFAELSLDGTLLPVSGALLAAELSAAAGDRLLFVAPGNAAEARLCRRAKVAAVPTLEAMLLCLTDETALAAALRQDGPPLSCRAPAPERPCLSQVRGQRQAKQALEVAAAGGHNLLMCGPPGSGKSLLARCLPGLLPPLSADEQAAVLRVQAAAQSARGEAGTPRWSVAPPFRAPHHSISLPAMVGGGTVPTPGEVTLSHHGVLFLDELPEFPRRVLEGLRGPLEDGEVDIARVGGHAPFPARCLVVAAMNPCPCGGWRPPHRPGDAAGPSACICPMASVQRYRAKISGPWLDRMDVRTFVDEIPIRSLAEPAEGAEPSAPVAARVAGARARQHARGGLNARLDARLLDAFVPLQAHWLGALERASREQALSLRGVARLRKVARTLADLRAADAVDEEDIEGALRLRGPL